MEELSVLDYVKALVTPWRGPVPEIPPLPEDGAVVKTKKVTKVSVVTAEDEVALPIRIAMVAGIAIIKAPMLFAVAIALVAQAAFEPPLQSTGRAYWFYVVAILLAVVSTIIGEWKLPEHKAQEGQAQAFTAKAVGLYVGLPLAGLAFLAFPEFESASFNRFTTINLILWIAAIGTIVWAFWLRDKNAKPILNRLKDFLRQPSWNIPVTRWGLVFIAALGMSLFFRFYQLNDVPREMFSDHIEKLLDVFDVRNGQYSIFFPRNTGREGLQMYLTAGIINLFNTGYSFLSLKLGTVIMGVVMLPYMYLLGKEFGGRSVGLIAMTLTGVAYWPNILARVGLRFILYPAFVAPTLYYLIRGLRRNNRNDFILSGIALGIGLHGYTPIRVLPIVVVIAVILFLMHKQARAVRTQALLYLGLLGLIAFVIFLPLTHYALENPDQFNYRWQTRVTTLEQEYPDSGSVVEIFLNNFKDALLMVNLSNSSAWTISLPNRPMLDIVSASMFVFGTVLLFIRYLRQRHWLDLFLLISIPLLMLPSILSLAFPAENPTASRAGGAMVPIFLISALALDGLVHGLKAKFDKKIGTSLAWVLGAFMVLWSANMNYDLTFNQYAKAYNAATWNVTEMGAVIANFSNTVGQPDSAWVVVFPHWSDNRLVAISAGLPPTASYELFPENIPNTLDIPAPKMFLVHQDDEESLALLRELYPEGGATLQQSKEGSELKDFYVFYVPPLGE